MSRACFLFSQWESRFTCVHVPTENTETASRTSCCMHACLPPCAIPFLDQRAKGLFANNDPSKGGSAYLQQKITIAEKILLEVCAGIGVWRIY